MNLNFYFEIKYKNYKNNEIFFYLKANISQVSLFFLFIIFLVITRHEVFYYDFYIYEFLRAP